MDGKFAILLSMLQLKGWALGRIFHWHGELLVITSVMRSAAALGNIGVGDAALGGLAREYVKEHDIERESDHSILHTGYIQGFKLDIIESNQTSFILIALAQRWFF
jgi:hypothetical protein